jgi:hypothetical protein
MQSPGFGATFALVSQRGVDIFDANRNGEGVVGLVPLHFADGICRKTAAPEYSCVQDLGITLPGGAHSFST